MQSRLRAFSCRNSTLRGLERLPARITLLQELVQRRETRQCLLSHLLCLLVERRVVDLLEQSRAFRLVGLDLRGQRLQLSLILVGRLACLRRRGELRWRWRGRFGDGRRRDRAPLTNPIAV